MSAAKKDGNDGANEGLLRVSSGNAELDEILGGGFPVNSVNIVMGEPGTGKTVLVENLVFANAVVGDRPSIYITTLSEPLEKIVRYLQQFSFFDPDKIGETVVYESIGAELAEKGVATLVPRLKEIIQRVRPKLIVIDSFKAIHDLDTAEPEMRLMLYQMAGLLTAYDTTTFLVGEYSESEIPEFSEFAVSDGILQLARIKTGSRDERYLRVLKLRGSAYKEGRHGFQLDRNGLEVFPRLVSPDVTPVYDVKNVRVTTGVAGLDEMLDGGLIQGTSTMILGPPGSGKTTLGLQFVLHGISRGEQGIYVHFEENPFQLETHVQNLGYDLDDLRENGFYPVYASPVELQMDRIVGMIYRVLKSATIRRVVIDAVGGLKLAANDVGRLQGFLYALVQHFSSEGICSILINEALEIGVDDPRLGVLSDNIIRLGIDTKQEVTRNLRIVKARNIAHDLQEHSMQITQQGVSIDK